MLPGILPRIRQLGLHFGHFAYLLALVFNSARLIQNNHPVLNAANIGRFGVRQVIAIAANNLTWSKNNVDQIAIFSAIIIGLILVILQVGLIGLYAIIDTASATPSAVSFFTPTSGSYKAEDDPVMVAFAQIFGDLNGFWLNVGDCEAPAGVDRNAPADNCKAPGVNSDIQEAVHKMLALYSTAMMVIAVIIVLYYVLIVIAEAAQTGTPFGRRFNTVWAPIRLIVALGLLIPLGSGLNSAQYITLWIAKMGSGLGSNVWFVVSDVLAGKPGRYTLDKFELPWVRDATARIFLMEVCRHAENKMQQYKSNIKPLYYKPGDDEGKQEVLWGLWTNEGVYEFSLEYKGTGDRKWFATRCGKIQVQLTAAHKESTSIAKPVAASAAQVALVTYNTIQKLTEDGNIVSTLAKEFAECSVDVGGRPESCPKELDETYLKNTYNQLMEHADVIEQSILDDSVKDFMKTNEDKISSIKNKMQKSWIYAGVWYLELGRLLQATKDLTASSAPNMLAGAVAPGDGQYVGIETGSLKDSNAKQHENIHFFWVNNVSQKTTDTIRKASGHYFSNVSSYVNTKKIPEKCVGVNDESGLMTQLACMIVSVIVPENLVLLADKEHKTLDPMTSLINAGKEITDRSITYISMGLAASVASSALGAIPWVGSVLGGIAAAMAKIFLLIGSVGISPGIVLAFLLPLFPFIYLFFAAVSWIMEIFEAVVAMPLWALAHLRIDGDGMPGQAAINGYFLLLAILLRPGLIVVGMVGGALIFSASIYMLQHLFQDVILVSTGGSATGLEILIYALIFAYLCYTAGITSFKLVDAVPNQILRWIGSGVSTFSDGREDPIGGNVQMAMAAGSIVSGQAVGALSELGAAPGRGLQDYLKGRKDKKNADEASAESLRRHNELRDAFSGSPKGSDSLPSPGGGNGAPKNPTGGGANPGGAGGGGGGGAPKGAPPSGDKK